MAKHRRADTDPFTDLRSDFYLPASLPELREMCDEANGCWVFPKTGAYPCPVPDATRSTAQAPRNAPHRWAWMLANNRTHQPLPSNVTVRHRCHDEDKCRFSANCIHLRCCNPQHLYLSASGSKDELAAADLDQFLAGGYTPGPVFGEDLAEIASMCDIDDASGCWLFTKRSTVACRTNQDERAYAALPKLTPHRWTWAVAHGRAANPLPSNMFHIRRRCARTTCCNPEHLFLTAPDGSELTLEQADLWINSGHTRWQDAMETAGWGESLAPVFSEDLDEIEGSMRSR